MTFVYIMNAMVCADIHIFPSLSHMFSSFFLLTTCLQWKLFDGAMAVDAEPAPLVPRTALQLMRVEIVISWTMFPIIEWARRYFDLDYQSMA